MLQKSDMRLSSFWGKIIKFKINYFSVLLAKVSAFGWENLIFISTCPVPLPRKKFLSNTDMKAVE